MTLTIFVNFGHPPIFKCGLATVPDGSIIRQVDEFKYFGSMMSTSQADLHVRRGHAWSAFWSMETLWRGEEVTLDLKIRIFKATCLSILLYGREAWSINKAMTSRLNSFATSCYRYMLNIKRTDRVRNDTVMEKTEQLPLSVTAKQRQLRWLGHLLRSDLRKYYASMLSIGHRMVSANEDAPASCITSTSRT